MIDSNEIIKIASFTKNVGLQINILLNLQKKIQLCGDLIKVEFIAEKF